MPLTLIAQNSDIPENSISGFIRNILHITQASAHTHEYTVHRLLLDMAELHHTGHLTTGEYYTIIGKGADVADFFHYDIEFLPEEENSWYRASLIHQIGQGILQATARIRPDITLLTFFSEAMAGLGMGKTARQSPITCRWWAQDLPVS